MTKETHDFFVKKILSAVQEMDEIGGPDTLEEYVAILQEVKKDIEQRISNAQERK